MNEELLTCIRSIIFSAKRCGSPRTAFNVISRQIGREVHSENWRQMSQAEGEAALEVLERDFPPRDLGAMIEKIAK